MYRLIIILFLFSSCKDTKDYLYFNKANYIIHRTDTSLRLYTKGCILSYEITNENNKNYISSGIFACTVDGENGPFYPMQIELNYTADSLVITSKDTCFLNSKLSSNNEFFIIGKYSYDFNWDQLIVIFYNEYGKEVERIKYNRNSINMIMQKKLWILSNPEFNLPYYHLNTMVSFKYFDNDKLIYKNDLPILPCWLSEISKNIKEN